MKDLEILLSLIQINIDTQILWWEYDEDGVPPDLSVLKEMRDYVMDKINFEGITQNRVDRIVKNLYMYNRILNNSQNEGYYVNIIEESKTIYRALLDSYFSLKLSYLYALKNYKVAMDKNGIDLVQFQDRFKTYMKFFEREIIITEFKAKKEEVMGKQNIFLLDNI